MNSPRLAAALLAASTLLGLPGIAVRVAHRAIAAVSDAAVLRDRRGDASHRADQRVVARLEGVQGLDMALGNDQHVRRSLGIDVVERHDLIVLVDQ